MADNLKEIEGIGPATVRRLIGLALEHLAPLPALVRHFIDALALLASQLGDLAQAAVLLAGSERLHSTQGFARDNLTAVQARRAHAALLQQLPAARRLQCQAQGGRMDAEALRQEALGWLRALQPCAAG